MEITYSYGLGCLHNDGNVTVLTTQSEDVPGRTATSVPFKTLFKVSSGQNVSV